MSKSTFFKNKFLITLAVLVLLIFFHYIKLLKPIENFVSYVFLPIRRELYEQGNNLNQIWVDANLNKKELAYQNQVLEKKVQDLLFVKSKIFELESENDLLRQQLNFFKQTDYKYLITRVVGNNLHHNINSYVLDKGSNDGVEVGQAVIVGPGIIVGKIRQVSPRNSELLLLTDNQSALATVVQNKDSSQGIVEGQYGLSMRMNLIPQNEEINHNDLIITSGIEQYIPRGLIIGEVDKVETEVNELFQSAIISPAVDYKKLNIVTVLVD